MNGRRLVIAGVAAFDAITLAIFVRRNAGEPIAHVPAIASRLSELPCVIVLAAAALVALTFFARGRNPLASGLVALAALAILEHTLAAVDVPGHQHAFFESGATLAGWLAGLAFARQVGPRRREDDEALAEAGAVAALAATYVGAGLSKLTKAGVLWADAGTLRSAILANHDVDDTSPLAAYARFVVGTDSVARFFAVATMLIQLGAFLYVVGPRMRMIWGTLLLSFHLNVALVTGIVYVQACVLLLALSYPWSRLWRRAPAPALEPFDPVRVRSAAAASARWIVAAVAAACLVRALASMAR